ncbi:MAG: DNA polymerase I [Chloroflexota bacterium]|nr:MAG: DNA polymerase I [Chloroflexota bacterium]
MPPTIFLLDGHALAYRTYFALTRGGSGGQHWVTKDGEPTAGVYGFASVLMRIFEQEQPEYLMVAFDTGKTFRDELFKEYKGTREKMPDDLVTQMVRVRELVDAFNIPRLEVEGYEADDVLGSVAVKAVEAGLGVKIITGDKDLLQLVSERVMVSLPGRSLSDAKDYLQGDVIEFIGVRPDQIVDFKALVGDKSDNIPGVRGVGEKTAIKLLAEYDSLESIYDHLEEMPTSVRNKLEKSREDAFMSQELARIVTDIDVPLDLDQARTEHFDPKEVEDLFRTLEFRSLFNRLEKLVGTLDSASLSKGDQLTFLDQTGEIDEFPQEKKAVQTIIIDSKEKLDNLVSELKVAEQISFDTETTSTDQMQAELVGISLAVDQQRGYYLPVGHLIDDGKQLPKSEIIEALRDAFENPKIQKVGHNIKYDAVLLARNGLRVKPLSFDTMIAEWLTNPTSRNLGLKNLAWVRLNIKMTEIEELIGKGRNQRSMAEVSIEDVAAYAADDAVVPLQLKTDLEGELSEKQAQELFKDIEMPLVQILADMEMAGIKLDVDYLAEMSEELSQRISSIKTQIYESVGEEFNLNSPQQLSEALFDRLQLTPPDRTQKTSSGFYSTAVGTLEAMKGDHPVVDWVLEYRELSKLKSTYVDALPQQVNPQTGRVHTSYNQAGSVTGRLASSDPNLQNIPIRTELGRQVRRAFVAEPGKVLLSVDYSQVELRIVAHMSGDETMLEAFRSGQDIHAATAAAVFDVPIEEVTKEQRNRAKGVNFGLIYGMSAFGLSRYTDITLAEAEDFVNAYFEQFPGVKNYLERIKRQAAEQEYIETLLGRRRYFPGLRTQTNRNIRNREEREAINSPIQGTAADIMKIAMLRVPGALSEAGLSGKMLLQVHDELVLECPVEELQQTADLVSKVMQEAYPLKIPLQTDARSGPNWNEMSPI